MFTIRPSSARNKIQGSSIYKKKDYINSGDKNTSRERERKKQKETLQEASVHRPSYAAGASAAISIARMTEIESSNLLPAGRHTSAVAIRVWTSRVSFGLLPFPAHTLATDRRHPQLYAPEIPRRRTTGTAQERPRAFVTACDRLRFCLGLHGSRLTPREASTWRGPLAFFGPTEPTAAMTVNIPDASEANAMPA